MVYIDSDGVLSDFDQWLIDVDCADHNKSDEVFKTLIKNQDSAFIDSKPIKQNNWIRKKMQEHDFRVLTSLPDETVFRTYFDSDEAFDKCYNKLIENKYRWFEKIGIPRDKVIITRSRKEKFKYCDKDSILYDDFPDTIKKWRELGGAGVLVRNPKCKAQRKRHYQYAIDNFDNVVTTIRKGIYRNICKRNFERLYHPVGESMCKALAKHETEYFMKNVIAPSLIYNPYTGKIYFTTVKALELTVTTANNKDENIELYMFNSFPKLFVKPESTRRADNYRFGTSFIKAQVCKYIPESEKKCGTKIMYLMKEDEKK